MRSSPVCEVVGKKGAGFQAAQAAQVAQAAQQAQPLPPSERFVVRPDRARRSAKREKRRKPPRGKPDRRSRNECRRRHEAPKNRCTRPNPDTVGTFLEVGVRSRSRNARATRLWAPRRRVSEGRMFSPTERPSSSLARSFRIRPLKERLENREGGPWDDPKTLNASDGKRNRRFEKTNLTNRTNRKNLRTRGLASRRAYALGEHARPWGSIPRGRRTPSGSRRCGRPT